MKSTTRLLAAVIAAAIAGVPSATSARAQEPETPPAAPAPATAAPTTSVPAATAVDPGAVESRELRFMGSKLFYLEAGQGGARTVLLLHGGRFSSATWSKLGTIELLARQGYRVVALDLPGFGRSEPTTVDREEYLASLLPLLTDRPVAVVSPSMSGQFSLPLLARHPDYVAGFVAVAPAAIPDYLEELKGSRVPTLLVWGDHDTVIPIEQARELGKVLVESRELVLENAQHPAYLDQPVVFHRELLLFLKSLKDHELF